MEVLGKGRVGEVRKGEGGFVGSKLEVWVLDGKKGRVREAKKCMNHRAQNFPLELNLSSYIVSKTMRGGLYVMLL